LQKRKGVHYTQKQNGIQYYNFTITSKKTFIGNTKNKNNNNLQWLWLWFFDKTATA